ncbi:MAG: hypothetical protein ACI9W2_004805, partial [Gammaproteobacteria bacterium]
MAVHGVRLISMITTSPVQPSLPAAVIVPRREDAPGRGNESTQAQISGVATRGGGCYGTAPS